MTPEPLDNDAIGRLRAAADTVGFTAWTAEQNACSVFDGPDEIACRRSSTLQRGSNAKRDASPPAIMADASPATVTRRLARLDAAERQATRRVTRS